MGRRRSKVLETQRRARHASDRFRKQRMKVHHYDCPWCHTHGEMFSKVSDGGRTIILGCTHCQLGEKFPRHPTLRVIDFYHMIIDNVVKKSVPTFKFPELLESDYEFLREQVTLGRIECANIIEEDVRIE